MPSQKTRVLVLGLGANGLGIARALHSSPNLDVWAIIFGGRDAGNFTRRVRKINWRDEISDPAEFQSKLIKVCRDQTRTILFPTRDIEVNLLAELSDTLPDRFLYYRNASDIVKALSDKNRVRETAAKAGLHIPKTIFLSDPSDPALTGLRFPVLVKPLEQNVSQTPFKNIIIYNFEELQATFKKHPTLLNYVVLQEFIPGGDDHVFHCNLLIDNDAQTIAAVELQKIRQYLPLRGMTSYGQTLLTRQLLPQSEQLARQVGYKGLMNVEFKLDDENGHWVFIETNLRLPIFNSVFPKTGVDLANLYVQSLIEKVTSPVYAVSTATWMHEENDLANILTHKVQTTFKVWFNQFIRANSFAYWCVRDPLPGIYSWARIIFHGLIRIFNGRSQEQPY
jgi:D-aspartate ligase